jgi:hypothetical protein
MKKSARFQALGAWISPRVSLKVIDCACHADKLFDIDCRVLHSSAHVSFPSLTVRILLSESKSFPWGNCHPKSVLFLFTTRYIDS